ncbi:hypothetical protein [Streptomyces abikoensis]|uniref:hypothetical protein n=1 Tax=Streptomyces abikoensis TaxID=97398 RepID=UPI00167A0F72|nr:hypothetical protein [Streptomyces abikoensis]
MKTPLRIVRIVCTTAVAALSLTACDDQGEGKARDERDTAVAYVKAINDRDVPALVKLSPPGNEGAEQAARELVGSQGGRGLRVDDVRVGHEFGPDTADARLRATDKEGRPFSETLTLTRRGGTWYVALGTAPGSMPKSPAQTSRP